MNKFKNYPFKRVFNIVNLSDLNRFENNSVVNLDELRRVFFSDTKKRIVMPIKILGSGELKKTLTVEANKFSEDAVKKIEALNGKANTING